MSTRAPSQPSISERPQQRGGIHANPWHRLLDSCKPSTMQGQVTEASITQSGQGVKEDTRVEQHNRAVNAGGFTRHIHHSLHTRADKEDQVTLLLQALRRR